MKRTFGILTEAEAAACLVRVSPRDLSRRHFCHHPPVADHRPERMLESRRVIAGKKKMPSPREPVKDDRSKRQQPPDLSNGHYTQQRRLSKKAEDVRAATPRVGVQLQVVRVELPEGHRVSLARSVERPAARADGVFEGLASGRRSLGLLYRGHVLPQAASCCGTERPPP